MGMYTELNIAVELVNDSEVLDILKYMLTTSEDATKPNHIPYHPLFNTARWRYMLQSDSFYFSGQASSQLFKHLDYYYLNVRCNLKNYEDEIEEFLNWLAPYIKDYGFIGYMRYEEDEYPTLIFCDNHRIRFEYAGKEIQNR